MGQFHPFSKYDADRKSNLAKPLQSGSESKTNSLSYRIWGRLTLFKKRMLGSRFDCQSLTVVWLVYYLTGEVVSYSLHKNEELNGAWWPASARKSCVKIN